MKYWQAWMACGLLMCSPAAAQADIYRWDNGRRIPGTEGITPGPGVQLFEAELEFADFRLLDLSLANLSEANLSNAFLYYSTLTSANLAGAVVTGANFGGTTSRGFTEAQLASTASYQAKDLQGIKLFENDLTGWDFSGQNLSNSMLYASTLTSAKLRGAVVSGALLYLTTSRGFTEAQLYSTQSYQDKNLVGIQLGQNDLTGWDFSGQNLSNASLEFSTLTSANLTGAVVTGAIFWDNTSRGFTQAQLSSTQSYQDKNLAGIQFWSNDLTGWDFNGQNLSNAIFESSTLTSADLSFADLRGANTVNSSGAAILRNSILPHGIVKGLDLNAGERLVVRNAAIPVVIQDHLTIADGGVLELRFDTDPWNSLISFRADIPCCFVFAQPPEEVQAGIPVQLGGTLELTFAADADPAGQLGRTLHIFDWAGVSPSGQFAIRSPYIWDVTNLYTTGEVTLLGVPESTAASILLAAVLATATRRRLRSPLFSVRCQFVLRFIPDGSSCPFPEVSNMVKRPRLFLIGTSLLLLAGAGSTHAAEIKIVSPSAYEHIEGEGEVGEDCCPPLRYQQVFPAADFAALGNKPHWLVDFTIRPDQSVTSPHTALNPDNEVRLSTTQRGPSNLSLVFDDNLGLDVMQFYRGPQMYVAAVIGPGPGPREFYQVDRPAGVSPFLYDPSQGNLLFDAIPWQGVSPSPRDDKAPLRTALYSFNPLATRGIRDWATIYQFTFIPVPEPSSLTLLAVLLVLRSLCRRATTTKTASSMPSTT